MAQRRSALRSFASLTLIAMVAAGVLFAAPRVGEAQSVRELFKKVTPSVVVIRAKGRDVTPAARSASPRRAPACSSRRTARS